MKKKLLILSAVALIGLSACGANTDDTKSNTNTSSQHDQHMNHSGSSEVPAGLKTASSPTYKVGSEVIMNADHMEGMDGAKATISGAYDTIVYAVSYTPTTGGAKVTNHKWVIHEELENAGDQKLPPGTEVTLKADHMTGMNGAKATIDSAEKTTVYMVDYKTADGQQVKNHKWVTEEELEKAN